MKKSFGKIKVKRANPRLDEVPEDCGYMQQFEFNIDMNSNGVMAECIEYTESRKPLGEAERIHEFREEKRGN